MIFLLALFISFLPVPNLEPQVGYWVCDAIRREKNADFVILPNTIFSDSAPYQIDSLVLSQVSIKELNQILSKNFVFPNFIPISGFTVIIDSIGNYKAVPNKVKEKYLLVTTKSLFCSNKTIILSEPIIEIFIAYLNKEKQLIFDKTNRYLFINAFVSHPERSITRNQESYETKTKININTATKEELETLPGIGPKTAQKIIDYRKEHGPFKSTKDIQNVSGIGPKKYEQIKNLITF